jgi:hypothetical protein
MYVYCVYIPTYILREQLCRRQYCRSQMVLLIHPPPPPPLSPKISVLLASKTKESWKDSGLDIFFSMCVRGFLSTALFLRRNAQKSFWQKSCFRSHSFFTVRSWVPWSRLWISYLKIILPFYLGLYAVFGNYETICFHCKAIFKDNGLMR